MQRTRASTGELEQRLSELRVLNVAADVDEILLGRNLNQLVPIGSHLLVLGSIGVEWNHCEGLTQLRITWADVSTVLALASEQVRAAATQTVEY